MFKTFHARRHCVFLTIARNEMRDFGREVARDRDLQGAEERDASEIYALICYRYVAFIYLARGANRGPWARIVPGPPGKNGFN